VTVEANQAQAEAGGNHGNQYTGGKAESSNLNEPVEKIRTAAGYRRNTGRKKEMLIMSKFGDRAIDDTFVVAIYVGKDHGKYVVTAQIDTNKAHLPNSFSALPIHETETKAEATELLRIYVELLNKRKTEG